MRAGLTTVLSATHDIRSREHCPLVSLVTDGPESPRCREATDEAVRDLGRCIAEGFKRAPRFALHLVDRVRRIADVVEYRPASRVGNLSARRIERAGVAVKPPSGVIQRTARVFQ